MNSSMHVKALLDSRNTLLEDFEEIGEAINQAIDVTELSFRMNGVELFNSILKKNLSTADDEVSRQGKPQNGLEVLALFVQLCNLIILSELYS